MPEHKITQMDFAYRTTQNHPFIRSPPLKYEKLSDDVQDHLADSIIVDHNTFLYDDMRGRKATKPLGASASLRSIQSRRT